MERLGLVLSIVEDTDGRQSPVVQLAYMETKERGNGRLIYWAHYKNVPIFNKTAKFPAMLVLVQE